MTQDLSAGHDIQNVFRTEPAQGKTRLSYRHTDLSRGSCKGVSQASPPIDGTALPDLLTSGLRLPAAGDASLQTQEG